MTTRRTLLSAAVLGLAPPALAAMPIPPSADSELIAACRAFEAADRQHWAEYNAHMQEITARDLPKADDTAARNRVLRSSQAYEPKREAMLAQIAALPATTREGLALKARVMQALSGCWDRELPPFTASDALLSSLIRDCMNV